MSLIPVAEALRRILDGVEPLGAERVPLAEADGRVLADDLPALRQQPPFPASAMDGYAARSGDVATTGGVLAVVGESVAGRGFAGTVSAGQAVRIFTGAPVPDGADTILIQENAERDGSRIKVLEPAKPGSFVRKAGLDFDTGDLLLSARTRLDYRSLALAASMGHADLPVVRRPVVAVVPTGDELVLPGETPGPDQIVASNQVGVCALARGLGAEALDLGIAGDTVAAITEKIKAALDSQADILVTLGGASVGDHDLVQEALGVEGMALDFWRIAMRPGKPLMFGTIGHMRVLGLPGNPVSSLVCAKLFLAPLVLRLLGLAPDAAFDLRRAVLGTSLPANDRRQDYIRAELRRGPAGETVATPFPVQDSSMLERFTRADALIVRLPFAEALEAGAEVEYLALP